MEKDKVGPVGSRLAERLFELRKDAGLTQTQLAAKLTLLGRPMLISALSRIEKGQRRVDVDDLVALALALNTSPNHLLLPATAGSDLVELAPTTRVAASSAWRWATRDAPNPPTRDFFISYAHSDATDNAEWMASVLRDAGYDVWFDQWELSPGSNLATQIREGIESSVASFVILSPAYANAEWSSRELEMIQQSPLRHSLIPVRFTDHAVPPAIADIVALNLVGLDLESASERVLEVAAQFASTSSDSA
jgi:transcriptional regulator with XRE-family HTH domain